MSKKAKNAKTSAPAPASVPTPPPTPVKAPGKKPSKTDDERPTVESILAAQSSLLYRGGSRVTETYDVIPFGIYGLDRYVLEVGGAIRGRIYEVVGHQSCLADSTYIQFQTRTPDGRLQNAKGGTIAELFTKFHNKPRTWRKNRRDRRSEGAVFTTASLTQSGGFRQNRILDVVDAGVQECFELKTARGHSITATAAHRFRVDDGFVRLESLRVGDAVWLHENTHRTSGTPKPRAQYAEVFVKNHPVAAPKVVYCRKVGKDYKYFRLRKSRAVVEADLNGLSLDEYIDRLNSGELTGLVFLPRERHVHHKDHDHTNDLLENLEIMSASEHGREHLPTGQKRFTLVPTKDQITSITPVGPRQTYDLCMEAPNHNFVADRFVVHNSGKTTLCLQLVANAQARGLQVAYIDAEHALDTAWAAARGVSVEDLLIGQPDCGEDALELVDSLCNSYQVGLVVIDSVAALVPRAELKGEMGDSHMGLQARLMSQALRKLAAIVAKSKTCVVFTNQYRKGMGGTFAPENVPTGGNALKFYASVRIETTYMGKIKSGEGEDAEVIGSEVRITAVKNKTAAPWRMIKLPLLFNSGYDDVANMVDLAVSNELSCVRKLSSSMWEVFGATVRGRPAAIEAARARADDLRAALDAFYRDGVVG